MRRRLGTLAVLAVLAAVAIAGVPSSGADEQATQSARTINVVDDRFRSGGLRISKGAVGVPEDAKVTFVWGKTDNPHNVKSSGSKGDRFRSKVTAKDGYRYSHRFAKTTRVICEVHPDTMKLKVNVR
jgi:plastocyanin